jgi:hypothetical protein
VGEWRRRLKEIRRLKDRLSHALHTLQLKAEGYGFIIKSEHL